MTYLTDTRKKLHGLAELSGREYRTSEFIFSELTSFGLKPKRVGTGVYCDIGRGKRIALRADIDALPIEEDVSVTRAEPAQGRVMHACGHDGHTANLLNTARILSATDKKGKRDLSVRLIFQHAEEDGGGSEQMIAAGALDGVEEIYALHLCPELPIGKVGYCYGGMFAGCCEFDCITRGVSAHCAEPSKGADAVSAALYMYDAIAAECTDRKLLFNLGKISGGSARNIIADYCKSEYTIRFYDCEIAEAVMARVTRAACAADKKFGTETEVKTQDFYLPVINDALCVDKVRSIMGDDAEEVPPRYTAEDFSNYLGKVPGCMVWLGVRDEAHTSPLHSSSFGFDERALLTGSQLFLELVAAR